MNDAFGTAASNSSQDQLREMLAEGLQRARAENPLSEHISDPITGLYNEPYTAIKLADEFKKARRFHVPLTLIAFGFDRGAGEERTTAEQALNEFAGLLLCESRDIDHLARVADDVFVALLPHTDIQGALSMASRVLPALASRDLPATGGGSLTASAGVAHLDAATMEDSEALLERARAALESAREAGGNRFTSWQAEDEA